jgi:signal transduction histidine kinase
MTLPQSLFARLLTGMIAVIGLALLIIILLIVHERRDLALWSSGTWSAADNIASASAELARLDPVARKVQMEDFRTQRRLVENMRPPPHKRPRKDLDRLERAFAERISKQLGPAYKVTVTHARARWTEVIPVSGTMRRDIRPPEGLPAPNFRSPDSWFDATVRFPDGDVAVFRTLAPLPGPPLPSQIFINLGLLTLVLSLVLYVMTRSVTRPLSDLAQAADAIGRGEAHPPLPETGARELRDATRAFNTMQERLHRYLDSRTRVVAAMSHDLRTPLTRLRLRAETIDDPQTQARFIADLDEMSRMVSGALNMFKTLNDEEPTTRVIVDDLLGEIQQEFAEMGLMFAIEGHSDGPILGKSQGLKRLLSNLLHNALKYGSNAVAHVRDGADLVIAIRDDGPGIPPAELERVFEPFYRVESSRNRDTGGTGLGLSIARDIAQAHGGSVLLRNRAEGGLEATITLPRGGSDAD